MLNMGDDIACDNLFEYLHMGIVDHFYGCCDKDETKNAAIQKLEKLGFIVGEKYMEKCTKEIPRFKDELDTMKFICKDFWMSLYKKQIDNLRTNHHGVYNLHDYSFKYFTQVSSGTQYKEQAPRFLAFSCGLLRGALFSVGLNCVVTAEVTKMPACKFLIQIHHT